MIRAFGRRLAARSLLWPGDAEASHSCGPGSRALRRGERFRLLSWNVQFAGSRDLRFFYDGGPVVSAPQRTVIATLDRLAAGIREADADVVLLQEVDRAARRTAWVDQHAALLARAPHPCEASAPYWRVRYVPFPPHEHLGAVHMDLSALSKLTIVAARRFPLARMREPAWKRAFNIRRGVLEVDVALAEGGVLRIFDVHLSAFSRGDGTLDRQVAEVSARLAATDALGIPWVLAGDLNALPPGDDARRLPDGHEYPEATSPIAPLLDRWECPVPAAERLEPRFRTYLPPGALDADRILDWVLVSKGVAVDDYQVLRPPGDPSDHRPLVLEARVR